MSVPTYSLLAKCFIPPPPERLPLHLNLRCGHSATATRTSSPALIRTKQVSCLSRSRRRSCRETVNLAFHRLREKSPASSMGRCAVLLPKSAGTAQPNLWTTPQRRPGVHGSEVCFSLSPLTPCLRASSVHSVHSRWLIWEPDRAYT
jgi:hypothetical protein